MSAMSFIQRNIAFLFINFSLFFGFAHAESRTDLERSARTGRNPKTGAPLEISARKAVRIAAGHGLKRAVAGLPASGN